MKINLFNKIKRKANKRIKKTSFLKRQTVSQAAIIIAVITFISKFIGYVREILIANYFGASGVVDAFLVASIIPSMILGLFAAGLNTLIIPVYIEKKAKDSVYAKKFVNWVFLIWGTIFLFASVLVLIFAPFLVKVVAVGFTGERFTLAVSITRYLTLSGYLSILTGLFTGLYHSEKQFLYPTVVAFVANWVIVLSIALLTPYLGINSWTVGQTLFAVISFLSLFLVLYKRYGFFHKLSFKGIEWNEIYKFAILLLPLIVSGGISTLNTIVDRTVASTLDVGSIAALNFAGRVWAIPISLLAGPIATAVFPEFSELAVGKEKIKDYSNRLNKTIAITWYFIIPAALIFITLSEPIVRVLFQRGAFDVKATQVTAFAVSMYSIGLFAHAANPLLGRVFYSFKNTITPVIISICTVGLNIVLNIVLGRLMGAGGIALATSLSVTFAFIVYNLTVRKYLVPFTKRLALETVKIVLCSAVVGVICYMSLPLFRGNLGFIALAVRLVLVGLIAGGVYLLLTFLLKVEGFVFFRDKFFQVAAKVPLLNRVPFIKRASFSTR